VIYLADDADDEELNNLKTEYPDEVFAIEDRGSNIQI
tara:strand:+ start:267 stop:377 length:111 start_codon:yes stop_codon:yes gene_type:complete